VVTDTGVLHETVRPTDVPVPAEVVAMGEGLAVGALDDGSTWQVGSMEGDGVYMRNVRICDIAVAALARHWPERYTYHWASTRMERDPQIVQARNVWRAAHGLSSFPVPADPAVGAEVREANGVSSLKWSGGAPLPNIPVKEGELLTAVALVDLLTQLHRDLPTGCAGFDLSAERARDRKGFVVAINWAPQADLNRDGEAIGRDSWSFYSDVVMADQSRLNSSGVGPIAHLPSYETQNRAFKTVLGGDPRQAISISFSSRVRKE
jgi:hypothetical protein